MMKKKYNFLNLLLLTALIVSSCKKMVQVPEPSISVNAGNVYKTDATAKLALNRIYIGWSSPGLTSESGPSAFITYRCGLESDDFNYLQSAGGRAQNYYQNSLTSSIKGYWQDGFGSIQTINAVIEGVTNSNSLTPSVKENLVGQAKFLRAFVYFYLVNLYGDVPIILTTDYKLNTESSRQSTNSVYQRIILDLIDAESLLPDRFEDYDGNSTSERSLPTKWAAKALLARIYLYTKDYVNALNKATEVIDRSDLFELVSLNDVFKKNSRESIWQLQPVNSGWNTEDGKTFIIPSTGPDRDHPISLSASLMNSFELGDQRPKVWTASYTNVNVTPNITYNYSYKYKSATQGNVITEYTNVFRLSELYIIRAECRAFVESGVGSAISDLNIIRNRAGLANYSGGSDQLSITGAILKERRVEFFCEWGHRWLDLKRVGKIDEVMSAATVTKGGTWQSYKQFWPLPTNDLLFGPNLKQNTGY
ncbi:RagB/SusD family nutrient uptake outer membrane protein [Pedobacter paludis]|uniref:RagB/SusD family nutrient uptake outer membrane protein n=1 Tax=Pedobacter paludis TaxID=2203212 RepID=A0A317F2D1_9SPHI|nr:RagB/SusD family nutrient uptake outer membrane protein [Pedobacter paludis]PWS33341.1 RagB/SusD family nutrient uptake outer membrane protein [Pedobacter paludis]